MALPRIIKDSVLTVDGVGYAGSAQITQWPKPAREMADLRTGGMSGTVKIDMGAQSMQMEIEVSDWDSALLKLFGAYGVAALQFRINGSAERDDIDGTYHAIEVVGKGRFSEIDPGGQSTRTDIQNLKYTVELASIKYSEDDAEIFEIDNANYILKVDGKDLLEQRRKNLKN